MKLTIEQLYGLTEGLGKMLDKELDIKVAYRLQKNFRLVEAEIKDAEEVRQKIVEKYKGEDNKDGTVKIRQENVMDYKRELDELMDEEAEVPLLPIKLDDLGDKIQPRILALLEPILDMNEEPRE